MASPSTQFDRGSLRTASHLRLLRVRVSIFGRNPRAAWMDAISPEALGSVCLIGVLQENFIYQDRHRFFEVIARKNRVDI